MLIIGISGKKRSGKSTVADFMKSLLQPNQVMIRGFADALKDEVVSAIYDVDVGKVDAKKLMSRSFLEAHKPAFRLILQGWGTDFRRQIFGEDYWIKKLDEAIHKFYKENDGCCIVIVPDVRFVNEAEYIEKLNGLLIRVERDIPGSIEDNHISENDLTLENTDWDGIIHNDGSLEKLRMTVKHLLYIQLPKEQNE